MSFMAGNDCVACGIALGANPDGQQMDLGRGGLLDVLYHRWRLRRKNKEKDKAR